MYTFESKEELTAWLAQEVVTTSEAMEILDCKRQNIHGFVKNGKLTPIKDSGKDRLFWRADVLQRKEEASKYNRKK
ncbi:helix-turn-helix domain-containing protein [Paenibacillus oenotherae]|uniref:Helix-turn-helix domain-containing protein n=1 Tax=Paenibacillus oenotherae TaxID=1435645 RepID=A0ABS7D7L2_9BACL|nr:helix-turn-helix domain-containing protein [Paenibacillus oenotherae]MBW7475938.1 helix-turn-helix domain-containing protein [Paenibacillus oenotherae]